MILEHRCPIYEGEDPFDPPKQDDPRMKPWLDLLVEKGIMTEDGTVLIPCHLMRGIGGNNYLFRLETK